MLIEFTLIKGRMPKRWLQWKEYNCIPTIQNTQNSSWQGLNTELKGFIKILGCVDSPRKAKGSNVPREDPRKDRMASFGL